MAATQGQRARQARSLRGYSEALREAYRVAIHRAVVQSNGLDSVHGREVGLAVDQPI
jgi:hypothetical protein